MKTPTMRSLMLCCAILLAVSSPCRAVDADKDKPINFSSDTGGVNSATGSGDLSGNVTITQGTLVLHADRITFKRNTDNSLSATAFGSPVSYRQQREGSSEYDEAFAQRIIYDGQKQLVELFGHALLKQGPTKELRSDYISYNRASGVANAGTPAGAATADKPASRVTGVIMPKDINSTEQEKGKKETGGKPADKAPVTTSSPAKAEAAAAGAAAPAPLTIDNELRTK